MRRRGSQLLFVCGLALVGLLLWVGSPLFVRASEPLVVLFADVQPGDVVINEFAAKGEEWVELLNSAAASVDLTGWYLDDKKCGKASNPLGPTTLAPGEYLVIKSDDPGWSFKRLNGDGELLRLCASHGGEIDRVAYGDQGGAPIAPSGSSTARTPDGWDTDDDARDWNLDPTPTEGEENDAPPVDLGGTLRINEVNNTPLPPQDAIEVYNPLTVPVSLTGWQICDGDAWGTYLADTLIPAYGLFVLNSLDFDIALKDEDVLYLFQPDGTRVDQMGVTYKDWDRTFQRVPNGTGPNTGYDWDSSGGGHTLLYLPPSLGRANVRLEGPQGGTPRWAQDRAAIGRLMQDFETVTDVCVMADIVLAGTAAGFDVSTWHSSRGASPLDFLSDAVDAGEVVTARELSCVILAAVGVDRDPRAFAERDLVAALVATQDQESGQFGMTVSDHALALLALRNGDTRMPSSAVARLRAWRTADGAWAVDGSTESGRADSVTTALVVQALFAAGDSDAAYGAFEYFRRMQNHDGGFSLDDTGAAEGNTHADATALILQTFHVGQVSLGSWTPHGTDPVGALLGTWDAESRGYLHSVTDPTYNLHTTARVIQALEGLHLVDVRIH